MRVLARVCVNTVRRFPVMVRHKMRILHGPVSSEFPVLDLVAQLKYFFDSNLDTF
jgi:hypothetical protein